MLSICYSQNLYDQKGKKTGKWIFKGKHHPFSGYTENTKVEEGIFILPSTSGSASRFWDLEHWKKILRYLSKK